MPVNYNTLRPKRIKVYNFRIGINYDILCRIILKAILTSRVGLGRIHVAQNRGKRRAVVSTMVNFHIPNNLGEFLD
jgi:hypothetical protein